MSFFRADIQRILFFFFKKKLLQHYCDGPDLLFNNLYNFRIFTYIAFILLLLQLNKKYFSKEVNLGNVGEISSALETMS